MKSEWVRDVNYVAQEDTPDALHEKELAFTDEFREFSRLHPGFILEAKKAIDSFPYLSDQGEMVVTENLTVECLGRHPNFATHERKYFRIKTKDGLGDFFVKVNHFDGYGERGAEELLLLSRLKEKLKDFKEFKVRVLDYALGYKDKKTSYFVANFDKTLQQTCGDIFRKVKNGLATEEEQSLYGKILGRVIRLKELEVVEGWGLDDFEEYNMSYDEENDEIVLFDIRRRVY